MAYQSIFLLFYLSLCLFSLFGLCAIYGLFAYSFFFKYFFSSIYFRKMKKEFFASILLSLIGWSIFIWYAVKRFGHIFFFFFCVVRYLFYFIAWRLFCLHANIHPTNISVFGVTGMPDMETIVCWKLLGIGIQVLIKMKWHPAFCVWKKSQTAVIQICGEKTTTLLMYIC